MNYPKKFQANIKQFLAWIVFLALLLIAGPLLVRAYYTNSIQNLPWEQTIIALAIVIYGGTILVSAHTPCYYIAVLFVKLESHQRMLVKVMVVAWREYRVKYKSEENTVRLEVSNGI